MQIQFVPHREHTSVSIVTTSQSRLHRETVGTYCGNSKKLIYSYTLWKSAEFLPVIKVATCCYPLTHFKRLKLCCLALTAWSFAKICYGCNSAFVLPPNSDYFVFVCVYVCVCVCVCVCVYIYIIIAKNFVAPRNIYTVKVKQSLFRPGEAQRVPGG